MPRALPLLPSLALAALLALPAAVQAEPDADTVVARVNGEEITLGQMIVAHATLPAQYKEAPANLLYDAILQQLIQQTALMQLHTGDLPKHIELSLANERRSLLAAEELEAVMLGAASEEDIKAAYDAKYADGFGGNEFQAAHILVETEDDAKAIKAELDGGADFAGLAAEKSTGPSGPNGGDLGWFSEGDMVPEFEAAVMALEPGQVSEPVQTQFGWHVIKLNDARKKDAPALDTVKDEIAGELRRDAVNAKIEEVTRAASIEQVEIDGLDPAILGNLDLVRN